MIHVFIGTKAQYIKTAPVIRALETRRVPYNLVDSGQHAHFAQSLREELAIRPPDVEFRQGRDISSAFQALSWLAGGFRLGALQPRRVFHEVFRGQPGVCLIHGDTPTALLSTFLAKRAGLAVAHLEAGLRSYNYLNPFPEEMIRMLVMRWADLLFAPGDWALRNLEQMHLKGQILNLHANTNVDSILYSLRDARPVSIDIHDFCLITFHRVENLYNRRRLKKIVDLVARVAASKQVLLVLHPPTEIELKKAGLYATLEGSRNIILSKLMPHHEFVRVLQKADFVMTDGGSIQEEAFYLNRPCLLLRKKTERPEGLGANVYISGLDSEKVDWFLENYSRFQSKATEHLDFSPSERVVDHLLAFMRERGFTPDSERNGRG